LSLSLDELAQQDRGSKGIGGGASSGGGGSKDTKAGHQQGAVPKADRAAGRAGKRAAGLSGGKAKLVLGRGVFKFSSAGKNNGAGIRTGSVAQTSKAKGKGKGRGIYLSKGKGKGKVAARAQFRSPRSPGIAALRGRALWSGAKGIGRVKPSLVPARRKPAWTQQAEGSRAGSAAAQSTRRAAPRPLQRFDIGRAGRSVIKSNLKGVAMGARQRLGLNNTRGRKGGKVVKGGKGGAGYARKGGKGMLGKGRKGATKGALGKGALGAGGRKQRKGLAKGSGKGNTNGATKGSSKGGAGGSNARGSGKGGAASDARMGAQSRTERLDKKLGRLQRGARPKLASGILGGVRRTIGGKTRRLGVKGRGKGVPQNRRIVINEKLKQGVKGKGRGTGRSRNVDGPFVSANSRAGKGRRGKGGANSRQRDENPLDRLEDPLHDPLDAFGGDGGSRGGAGSRQQPLESYRERGFEARREFTEEDLKMMKKITIVAQLDKVPKPLAAMRSNARQSGEVPNSLGSRFGANFER